MKGKISDKLEQMLQDPHARLQLRESLTSSTVRSVTIGNTTYRVSSVRQEPLSTGSSPEESGRIELSEKG